MDYNKISPELQYLYKKNSIDEISIQSASGVLGFVSPRINTTSYRAAIFMHCNPKAKFEEFKDTDIYVNHISGAIRTAFLPISKISELSEHKDVYWLDGSRILKCNMNDVSKLINLPISKDGHFLKGEDVIIGIVDNGIHYHHDAFWDHELDESRIISVWDQIESADREEGGVKEGGYGRELTGDDCALAFDRDGHGTHVAGIAGGSGQLYPGVAPKSKFVIVRTDFHDAHVADAIKYIFRIAEESQKPAVINLSLGGHLGSHDGTDSFSRFIDQESGKGKIVCVAAGNEGSDQIHAQVKLPKKNKTLSIDFKTTCQSHASNINPGCIFINGWYSGKGDIELKVITPNGHFKCKNASSEDDPNPGDTPDGKIEITFQKNSYLNSDKSFLIAIEPETSNPGVITENWCLQVKSSNSAKGRLDLWLLDRSNKVDAMFVGPYADSEMTIGTPGCANKAITVGSVVSKSEWTDITDTKQERAVKATPGKPSSFSSKGPLRIKGKYKPDICAPGEFICAPLSRYKSIKDREKDLQIDNDYWLMRGTSMATPVITGIVALLLGRNPKLGPTEIKNKLKKASVKNSIESDSKHDSSWGYGMIDAKKLDID